MEQDEIEKALRELLVLSLPRRESLAEPKPPVLLRLKGVSVNLQIEEVTIEPREP